MPIDLVMATVRGLAVFSDVSYFFTFQAKRRTARHCKETIP